MLITVQEAIEAYEKFYGISADRARLFGYSLTTSHDLYHLILGRVPDYIADGMSIDDAIKQSHENHLNDFVWFHSELLLPIYHNAIESMIITKDASEIIDYIDNDYYFHMNKLFNTLSKFKAIKTPYRELQEIIDKDIERGELQRPAKEEIKLHYDRAMRIRESIALKVLLRFNLKDLSMPLGDFADPDRHLEHKPTSVDEVVFDFSI